jgi:nucleotide-binding universal stress UspA family protein
MFKHLLVPLDGSKLAESSLPAAVLLCKALGATVTLLHIIEKDAPQEVHGDRHLTDDDEACKYLDQVALRYFPEEIQVESHVHTEEVQDVARSIVEHSGEFAPDLIVMCAHGEGGWYDLVVGGIAQQVIGLGKTPILLVRPGEAGAQGDFFKRILVPLDGETGHEGCLPVAGELARRLGAGLALVTVVHTLGTLPGARAASGWLLPGATRAILDIDEESAREYLERLAAEWRAKGLKVTGAVRRGDPVQQILISAQLQSADMIVLATHGKAGMDAFWSGSVAPKLVISANTALLLVPVKKG